MAESSAGHYFGAEETYDIADDAGCDDCSFADSFDAPGHDEGDDDCARNETRVEHYFCASEVLGVAAGGVLDKAFSAHHCYIRFDFEDNSY